MTRTNSLIKSSSNEGAANRWQNRSGTNEFGERAQQNDLFGNKDGQVFRQDNGQWQRHDKDGWQRIGQSRRTQGPAVQRPAAAQPQDRPAVHDNTHQFLDNQRFSRQLGNERFATRREAFRGGGFGGFQRPSAGRFGGRFR